MIEKSNQQKRAEKLYFYKKIEYRKKVKALEENKERLY